MIFMGFSASLAKLERDEVKSAEQEARAGEAAQIKHHPLHLKFSNFMEMFQQILLRVKFNFIVLKCE